MRYIVFLLTFLSVYGVFAGTYQDEAGNRIPLKTKAGQDHPFHGHLAPDSHQQNIDLSDADLTQGPKPYKKMSEQEQEMAKIIRFQLRNNQKLLEYKRVKVAKLKQQINNSAGPLNAPKLKKPLIDQAKHRIRRLESEIATLGKWLKQKKIRFAMTAAPDLRGIDLRGAKFEHAKLDGAKLAEANLAKADLVGASLVKTDLSDANMRNVELGAAHLKDANLSRSNLRGAGIYAVDFTGADLSGAILRDVDGWEDAVWADAYYQVDDPPWWPDGMDPKKFNIREVKPDPDVPVDATLE